MIDRDELDVALENKNSWEHFISNETRSLSGVDFSEYTLKDLDFSGLDLENCDFSRSSFDGCNFSRCNFYNSNWSSSRIMHSNFLGSLLTNSNFSDSEFESCDFTGAELSHVLTDETNVSSCDFSRARGVSQYILDQIVGDTTTSIPQFLDYPDHWLLTNDDKEKIEWKKRLSSSRGEDLLLCIFDGSSLSQHGFASPNRDEIKQTLNHIQKQLRYAVEDKLFHNESPAINRAICDYYEIVTSNAGKDEKGNENPRWLRKIYELDEISIGLQGNNLITQLKICKGELGDEFPEKIASLEHIVHSHVLLASALPRWKSFLQTNIELSINNDDLTEIEKCADAVCDILYERHEIVDPNIPHTIKAIKKLITEPIDSAKIVGAGIVGCIESIFTALFSFSKRFLSRASDEAVELGSKVTIRLLITGLLTAGVHQVFSIFPHLKIWFEGALVVLRSLGVAV